MPAYDYRCTACGHTFEITRPFGSTGEVTCPACGGATKRVYTPVGVHFKGSGFHNTDYRSPKKDEPSGTPKGSCDGAGSASGCAGCPAAN
jgi:putative FmdB family regulatory protein